ncbi:MAG: hypothetical protein IT304_04520 [Dehalococcoidia bacterium]|nr:hypothetical protein [Dehalococcoidia bacterium]
MNDAIALLAISQLVCLAALGYLYAQLNALRRDAKSRRTRIGQPAHHDRSVPAPRRPGPAHDDGALASRLSQAGVDVPTLARRMNRSEEEVRLLLRRRGIAS